MKNKPLPAVDDRVFLKTKNGYVDPTSWKVLSYSENGKFVTLNQATKCKSMTLKEFRAHLQESYIVDFTPSKEELDDKA
jgi:hypothetical protein